MKMCIIVILAALCLSGCGGGGGGGGNGGGGAVNNNSSSSLNIGYIQLTPGGPTSNVVMIPAPPAATPPSKPSGSVPTVTVYQTTQFASAVYDYSMPGYWYSSTSQVAYGTVSGVKLSAVQLEVFAETNTYYIQPLTDCFVTINSDGSWVCPANPEPSTRCLSRRAT